MNFSSTIKIANSSISSLPQGYGRSFTPRPMILAGVAAAINIASAYVALNEPRTKDPLLEFLESRADKEPMVLKPGDTILTAKGKTLKWPEDELFVESLVARATIDVPEGYWAMVTPGQTPGEGLLHVFRYRKIGKPIWLAVKNLPGFSAKEEAQNLPGSFVITTEGLKAKKLPLMGNQDDADHTVTAMAIWHGEGVCIVFNEAKKSSLESIMGKMPQLQAVLKANPQAKVPQFRFLRHLARLVEQLGKSLKEPKEVEDLSLSWLKKHEVAHLVTIPAFPAEFVIAARVLGAYSDRNNPHVKPLFTHIIELTAEMAVAQDTITIADPQKRDQAALLQIALALAGDWGTDAGGLLYGDPYSPDAAFLLKSMRTSPEGQATFDFTGTARTDIENVSSIMLEEAKRFSREEIRPRVANAKKLTPKQFETWLDEKVQLEIANGFLPVDARQKVWNGIFRDLDQDTKNAIVVASFAAAERFQKILLQTLQLPATTPAAFQEHLLQRLEKPSP